MSLNRVKLLVVLTFIVSCFIITAHAADMEYRFMHNDHDTLIVGEIMAMDEAIMEIRAADYVVSVTDLNIYDIKEQLRPEAVRVDISEWTRHDEFSVGAYVLVSLNKDGDVFTVANGIYKVDSTETKTLEVEANTPGTAAALTDFVNSGGVYTEYAYNGAEYVTRRHDGESVVIYPATETTAQMQSEHELPEPYNDTLIIAIIAATVIGLGVVFGKRFTNNR